MFERGAGDKGEVVYFIVKCEHADSAQKPASAASLFRRVRRRNKTSCLYLSGT